jgi:O-antigen/teichoic acid export membrane protein
VKTSKPLKNLFSIIFGRSSELILTFFAITFLIRYLGAENYGVFSAIVATIAILSKFIDLGFSQIIFREFSANSSKKYVINSAISIRLLLLILLVISYNIFAYFTKINSQEVIISNILFVNIVVSAKLRNIRDLFEIPFKSSLRMDIVMIATFIDALTLLLLVLLASYFKFTLLQISILYVAANIPGFSILLYFLRKWKPFKFKVMFNNLKWLLSESMPLFGAGILAVLFMQLDVVLLKHFISSQQAGLYSAAIRVGVPLSIIPLSIVTTIFPIVTKSKDEDLEKSKQIVEFSFKMLLLLLFYSALFISFKAEAVLKLLYGAKFLSASTSLILLFWSFTFYYLGVLLQNLNTIIGKQKYNFYYSVLLVAVFLVMLFITLLNLGAVGAGLSRLTSAFVGFLFLYSILLKSELSVNFFRPKQILFFIVVAIIGYFLRGTNLIIFTLLFTFLLVVLTLLSKYFSKEDYNLLYKLLKEPKWLERFVK